MNQPADAKKPPEPSHRRVLIIDDNTAIHTDFKKVLTSQQAPAVDKLAAFRAAFGSTPAPKASPTDFDLSFASQGLDGVALMAKAVEIKRPYSVAFVDIRMPPGIDGVQTAKKLWELDDTLQVIICTAFSDYSWEQMVEEFGNSGRWVILRKPFDPVEVRQLASAMTQKWKAARSAQEHANKLSEMVKLRTRQLEESNRALQIKMESLEKARKHIEYLALHDSLTQLPNRRYLEKNLEDCLSKAKESQGKFAILSVDVNGFKRINDSLGHGAGDIVLKTVANRLLDSVRTTDSIQQLKDSTNTVARFGGDEFIILLRQITSLRDAQQVAERIERNLQSPLFIDEQELRITASIGVSLYPEHGTQPLHLLANADTAMYRSKSEGRAKTQIYSEEEQKAESPSLQLEVRLSHAIENREFELHYQPIFNPASKELAGAEALIRWQDPDRGLIPPFQFLPTAEESDLIGPLGDWVIEESFDQMVKWHAQGLSPGHISINISPKQIYSKNLVPTLASHIERTGLSPTSIIIELTETALLKNEASSTNCIHQLVEMGFRVALDDFGTGYSSLRHLVQLPIQIVKIDKSFVRNLHINPSHGAVVKAILGLSQGLDVEVIAEGVETVPELNYLIGQGCMLIQGYLFSRPVTSALYEERFLRKQMPTQLLTAS